jgi:VWFA-related protein
MLKSSVTFFFVLLVAVLQTSVASQKRDESVRIGVNVVTLDIAVTDKRRRPVLNLTAKDFTVLEDGVPQRIESFNTGSAVPARVEQKGQNDHGGGSVSKSNDAAHTTNQPFAGYRYISLVIDNTSVQAANRDPVERALTRYVRERLRPDDLAAIYAVGNSLSLVQPFTADREKLLKGARGAVQGQLATDAAGTREAAAEEVERAARSIGTGSSLEQGDNASRAVFESYNDVSDYFQAQTLFRSLHAIADVQRKLTGSKSIVLFSEGAILGPSSGYAVDGVISAANAAGVSVYAIDAAGLSVGEATRGIDPRGNLGLPTKQRPDIYGGEDPTAVRDGENGLERALKRQLATAQPDRVGLLTRLSNQTGGIAVTNNNDLFAGLDTIDSDLRARYEITYVPTNHVFDGRFREIAVKLTNPDLTVRTRRGYYAVKSEAAITEDASVSKLAADMANGISPAFALEMGTSFFPRGKGAYLVPVTIKAPGSAITTQKKGEHYYTTLDFVMTAKNASGEVVSTFGRAYPLELSADQTKELSESALPIRHNVRLGPGTYIITTALRDRASGRTSVARRGVTLPALTDGPQLSSIVLAQQSEQLPDNYPASQLSRDVLAFGHNRIVMPTSSRFTSGQTMLLFFRVYPAASTSPPSLVVGAGFFKDGKVVRRTPAVRLTQSPSPSEVGFPMATPLTLADLEPGDYTLRVELFDETTRQKEIKEAHFVLSK